MNTELFYLSTCWMYRFQWLFLNSFSFISLYDSSRIIKTCLDVLCESAVLRLTLSIMFYQLWSWFAFLPGDNIKVPAVNAPKKKHFFPWDDHNSNFTLSSGKRFLCTGKILYKVGDKVYFLGNTNDLVPLDSLKENFKEYDVGRKHDPMCTDM